MSYCRWVPLSWNVNWHSCLPFTCYLPLLFAFTGHIHACVYNQQRRNSRLLATNFKCGCNKNFSFTLVFCANLFNSSLLLKPALFLSISFTFHCSLLSLMECHSTKVSFFVAVEMWLIRKTPIIVKVMHVIQWLFQRELSFLLLLSIGNFIKILNVSFSLFFSLLNANFLFPVSLFSLSPCCLCNTIGARGSQEKQNGFPSWFPWKWLAAKVTDCNVWNYGVEIFICKMQ